MPSCFFHVTPLLSLFGTEAEAWISQPCEAAWCSPPPYYCPAPALERGPVSDVH